MSPQWLPSKKLSLVAAVPGCLPKPDRRIHRRRGPDEISLTFLGVDHPVLNWSQGGVLITDRHPDLAVGVTVSGVLSIRGQGGWFRFSAKLLRRDMQAREIAFFFVEPSPALCVALSRLSEQNLAR